MELHDQIETINSKEKLADFIGALRQDLEQRRDQWENLTLEDYLEAMQSWIEDSDGYCRNRGQQPIQRPTWQAFAQILAAATMYE